MGTGTDIRKGGVIDGKKTVCKNGMRNSSYVGGTVFMKVRVSDETTHAKHLNGT